MTTIVVLGGLLHSPVASNGVQQGFTIPPFPFNFAVHDILQTAVPEIQDLGIEVLLGSKFPDLEYADYTVSLCL